MTQMTNQHWSSWRRANFAYFRDKLSGLPERFELIDLGAGPLQFRELFKRFKYTGVDFQHYPDVTVIADFNASIPLPDTTADIVTLSNTLEHLSDPRIVLAESYRLLRPGGVIIGTVPFLVQVHQAPYDFNRYTNFQLEKLLKDVGFTNIVVVPLGELIDAYNTMELKFFDHHPSNSFVKLLRIWRRLEMRLLKRLLKAPSTSKYTEGYGFSARKPD